MQLARMSHAMNPARFPPSNLSFVLPLDDAGAGAVNLAPLLALGSATPTFTRATAATTISSAGLIIPVSSGVARSYFDPTTLKYGGYLPEGARTNLCLRSEEFDNASWTKTATTISANATTGPDGNATADKIQEDNTTAVHRAAQAITVAATSTWTYSVFVKAAERTKCFVLLSDNATGQTGAFVDLSAGTVIADTNSAGSWTALSRTIKAYPNGWYRVTVTGTMGGASTTALAVVQPSDGVSNNSGSTYLGTTGSGVYAWGAQLEQAAFASTYIPTAAASVTRNADALTYATSGNIDGTVGTAYCEVTISSGINSVNPPRMITVSTAAERDIIYASTATRISAFDGTGSALGPSASVAADGVTRKYANKWSATNSLFTTFFNGVAGSASSFDGDYNVGTVINIGFLGNAVDFALYGTIRNVRIWNTQLSDADLQALTA